jgi:hypothetical protein
MTSADNLNYFNTVNVKKNIVPNKRYESTSQ